MLKSVYLPKKLSNVRDSLSILCKCLPAYFLLFPLYSMSVNKCSRHLLYRTLEALNSLLNAITSLFRVL